MNPIVSIMCISVALIGGVAIGHSIYPQFAVPDAPVFSGFPEKGSPEGVNIKGVVRSYDENSHMLEIEADNPYNPQNAPLPLRIRINENIHTELFSEKNTTPPEHPEEKVLLYNERRSEQSAVLVPGTRILIGMSRTAGAFKTNSLIVFGKE